MAEPKVEKSKSHSKIAQQKRKSSEKGSSKRKQANNEKQR